VGQACLLPLYLLRLPSQLLLKSLRGITKISSFTSPDFVEQKVGPQQMIFLQKSSLGKMVMLEI
jgi:hypothetical protein